MIQSKCCLKGSLELLLAGSTGIKKNKQISQMNRKTMGLGNIPSDMSS